jgi:TctA family transporter
MGYNLAKRFAKDPESFGKGRVEGVFALTVFWSNGLVGSITTLAILLLFWPLIDETAGGLRRFGRRAKSSG